jgi:serine phosphatase RsbU (regulator of sigma subunit)
MKQNNLLLKTVILLLAVLLVTSCGQRKRRMVRIISDADKQIEALHRAHNYDSLQVLVDSFQRVGSLNDLKANYWHGYVCSRKGQERLAEIYWKKAIEDVATDAESLDYYAKSASRLSNLLLLKGDYEGTLKVALAAKARMEETNTDTVSEYSNVLATIASCQLKMGNTKQAAEDFERAYKNYVHFIQNDRTGYLYKSAIVGMINTTTIYLSAKRYEDAYVWTERFDSLLTLFEQQPTASKDYIDKQRARLNFYRATELQELGKPKEAAEAYKAALNTQYAKSADGHIEANDYLMTARRWNEAADNFEDLDWQMSRYGMELSLDNIQKYYLPKFRANLGARRKDSVIAVGAQICNALDSAIYLARQDDAAELATIYDTQQKEAQIARQRAEMTRIQMVSSMVALILVVFFLSIYIWNRRKAAKRLAAAHAKLEEAHGQLKVAYDQLEDTTKAKERIESELRIAREIQRRMLPHVFPCRRDVDIYAMMTPAKEVGGDLYAYALLDDLLYFCVGDVSGKGVPAALFMAEVTRMFRTLVDGYLTPNTIATRLNHALAEDNDQGMFVTMFIGLINLKTGHMGFCNAGHNPPLLDGEFMKMEANAPIGLWPDLDYEGEEVIDMHGKTLFVYTDGINEAENANREQFGDERLQALLQQDLGDARQTSETIHKAVEDFVGGAEPSDDLTKMCIKMK